MTRTFTSFTQAATENARSRVYLGVHYQFDADDGMASGTTVAAVATTKLLAMKCNDPLQPDRVGERAAGHAASTPENLEGGGARPYLELPQARDEVLNAAHRRRVR